ncbi:MAG: GDYXXLXY domain-containing protein [Planctomycetes bacterium]|nr:GDYXXLXY domain-containing protein [Planctomycetota bacterium]
MTKTKTTFLFLAAVIVQLAILALVPAKQIYARATGRLITLKVVPVDPYNILSGHYMTLGYKIAQMPSDPRQLDGRQIPVYVVLKEDPNKLWVVDSVNKQKPSSIPPDKLLIRGRTSYRGIEYGIEAFFVPEDKREKIAADFRANQNNARAEIKVDRFGNPALIKLLLGDNTYEY